MKIIKNQITIGELKQMSQKMFGNLVKAVIDIEKEVMAIDGQLHSDEEALLIEQNSKQNDLWGINLYPELFGSNDFIEFDSMINLRPAQGNRTRSVDDPIIQEKIKVIVNRLVAK